MNKIWSMVKITTLDSLQNRTQGFIWSLTEVVPAIVMIFFWSKVFETQALVNGRSQADLISYYLISALVVMLLITHPDHDVSGDINRGTLNNFLIKPMSYSVYSFIKELTYKLNRSIFVLPLYSLFILTLVLLTKQNLMLIFTPITVLLLINSFILAFLIKYSIGLLAFWFTQVYWAIGLDDLLTVFLSGMLIPLYLFPAWFQELSNYLPFQLYVYVPVQSLLGQFSQNQNLHYWLIGLAWIVIFLFINWYMWQKGTKKYAAFGG